ANTSSSTRNAMSCREAAGALVTRAPGFWLGRAACGASAGSLRNEIRSHELVVFVIEDVAVLHVSGAIGGIEPEWILAGCYCVDGQVDWRPACGDSGDLTREHFDRVLPPSIVRVGGPGRTRSTGARPLLQ